MNYFGKF